MTTAIPPTGGIRCYIAGPMRGYDCFNFPAFDECAEWLRSKGWDAVNPAEIDRELGLDPSEPLPEWFSLEHAMHRDLHEITHPLTSALVLLPRWSASDGAIKEVTTAMACGHDIYLYEPDGIFDDYLNGGMFDDDKRLVQVSYSIVEAIIAREQAEHDEQYLTSSTSFRTFISGATRDLEDGKLDFEGAISPQVLWEFVQYMERHSHMPDGTTRSADNWQKGFPNDVLMKSLLRHVMDVWMLHRGQEVTRPESGKAVSWDDALGGLMFNTQALWYNRLVGK